MALEGFKDYDVAKKKLVDNNFCKGLVGFGSARLPMDHPHIKEIEEISHLCAKRILDKNKNISFITGGGPSVMEAWLKPAHELGAQTGGIALVLPHETKDQQLQFCNKDTSCTLETFQARKMIMYEYAKCIIIFKGGFGTMDELYSALTMMKTKKIKEFPIFVYPADFYKDLLNFDSFLEEKTIKPEEKDIITFFNKKEDLIQALYDLIDQDDSIDNLSNSSK